MRFLTYPKDNQIHRIEYKANGYVNVTEMAKIFGKNPKDFFAYQMAKDYVSALSRSTGIPERELKYVVKGNYSPNGVKGEFSHHSEQGTFCHPKLAIRFAQWLNADFAVWVDGKILEIIGPKNNESALSLEEMALKAILGLQAKVETQKAQIEELTPKAEFADHVEKADSQYSFREACKILALDIGERRLFDFCRKHGILMSSNEPYQEYMEAGYFKFILEKFEKPNGSLKVYKKTVITGKGLNFLDKKLRKEGHIGVVA